MSFFFSMHGSLCDDGHSADSPRCRGCPISPPWQFALLLDLAKPQPCSGKQCSDEHVAIPPLSFHVSNPANCLKSFTALLDFIKSC